MSARVPGLLCCAWFCDRAASGREGKGEGGEGKGREGRGGRGEGGFVTGASSSNCCEARRGRIALRCHGPREEHHRTRTPPPQNSPPGSENKGLASIFPPFGSGFVFYFPLPASQSNLVFFSPRFRTDATPVFPHVPLLLFTPPHLSVTRSTDRHQP